MAVKIEKLKYDLPLQYSFILQSLVIDVICTLLNFCYHCLGYLPAMIVMIKSVLT